MLGVNIGDRVMVDSFEGFGGTAVVVESRDHPTTSLKVVLDNGTQPPFWAHDFEVSALGDRKPDGYDSRPDTWKHILEVRSLLAKVVGDLEGRGERHDLSKLQSPEVEVFNEFTPKLKATTYGSDDYRAFLAAMKPALDHHYAHNSHHPEHFADGVHGMSLLDVLEMLCDWKAATLRHADGDIRKSVELNQRRFGYSDELKQILLNTLPVIEAVTP